jgi:hypothetical protein
LDGEKPKEEYGDPLSDFAFGQFVHVL